MSGPTNRSDGLVTQAIRQLITKQVDDHALVIRYNLHAEWHAEYKGCKED